MTRKFALLLVLAAAGWGSVSADQIDALETLPQFTPVREAFAGWLQRTSETRTVEILGWEGRIDVVDGVNGPGGGREPGNDNRLRTAFLSPLSTDRASMVGRKLLADRSFVLEKPVYREK